MHPDSSAAPDPGGEFSVGKNPSIRQLVDDAILVKLAQSCLDLACGRHNSVHLGSHRAQRCLCIGFPDTRRQRMDNGSLNRLEGEPRSRKSAPLGELQTQMFQRSFEF